MNHDSPNINGEVPVLLIHTHWVKYLTPILLILLSWFIYFVCEVLSFTTMRSSGTAALWVLIVGHVFLLLFHHVAFYQIFSVNTKHFLITNKRILGLKQSLWLSDDTTDIPLWKVRSMEVVKTGILQSVLNYGSIVLNKGDFPSIGIVPHPNFLQERITFQLQELQPTFRNTSPDIISNTPHA